MLPNFLSFCSKYTHWLRRDAMTYSRTPLIHGLYVFLAHQSAILSSDITLPYLRGGQALTPAQR